MDPLALQVLGLLAQASLDLTAVPLLLQQLQEAELDLQPEVAWQLRRELAWPLQVWENQLVVVSHLAPFSMVFVEFVASEVLIHAEMQMGKDYVNLVNLVAHHV